MYVHTYSSTHYTYIPWYLSVLLFVHLFSACTILIFSYVAFVKAPGLQKRVLARGGFNQSHTPPPTRRRSSSSISSLLNSAYFVASIQVASVSFPRRCHIQTRPQVRRYDVRYSSIGYSSINRRNVHNNNNNNNNSNKMLHLSPLRSLTLCEALSAKSAFACPTALSPQAARGIRRLNPRFLKV